MQHDKQQGKRPLTALNFYLSAFFHHAANQGLDAARLLQDAGIARDCVDNAARRIDIAQLAAFIIAICDALQDESMALSAWPVPRGSLYMMGIAGLCVVGFDASVLQWFSASLVQSTGAGAQLPAGAHLSLRLRGDPPPGTEPLDAEGRN
jgi:hypothetical protein